MSHRLQSKLCQVMAEGDIHDLEGQKPDRILGKPSSNIIREEKGSRIGFRTSS
jgi:hypothetical protein